MTYHMTWFRLNWKCAETTPTEGCGRKLFLTQSKSPRQAEKNDMSHDPLSLKLAKSAESHTHWGSGFLNFYISNRVPWLFWQKWYVTRPTLSKTGRKRRKPHPLGVWSWKFLQWPRRPTGNQDNKWQLCNQNIFWGRQGVHKYLPRFYDLVTWIRVGGVKIFKIWEYIICPTVRGFRNI